MGDDIVILLTGGVSHIGTHVTAIPYEKNGSWHVTLQTWNMISHRDDILAIPYARELALLTHHTVVCVCGVHLMILQGKKLSISAHGVKRIENI